MNLASGFLHAIAVLGLSILAAISAVSAPTASFTASTPNPAAGSVVVFTDTSSGTPASWTWDFGDGVTSTSQNPAHAWTTPGSFTVRLTATNATGSNSSTLPVTVTPDSVLRLNAAHTFDLTLTARDPRTGTTGAGKVIGQNDVYGYYSIPTVSGNAGNPEVIVKMVDASAIGASYWVFYGCMTDLEYTLTVQENATGVTKTYTKDPGKPCGQFDTTGFLPTPIPPTPTTGPVATPTPTASAGPTIVTLTAKQFEWNFNGTGTSFVAKVGTTYEFHVTDIDRNGSNQHGFSGIPSIGLSGFLLSPGQAARIVTYTPKTSHVGFHPFSCSESGCGDGHDRMLGLIQVVP